MCRCGWWGRILKITTVSDISGTRSAGWWHLRSVPSTGFRAAFPLSGGHCCGHTLLPTAVQHAPEGRMELFFSLHRLTNIYWPLSEVVGTKEKNKGKLLYTLPSIPTGSFLDIKRKNQTPFIKFTKFSLILHSINFQVLRRVRKIEQWKVSVWFALCACIYMHVFFSAPFLSGRSPKISPLGFSSRVSEN